MSYTNLSPVLKPVVEIYQSAIDDEVFSVADITKYVKAYAEAEQAAFNREFELDALLSNINQEYKEQFLEFYPETDDRKTYIALLNRYIKLYYFIAQFFELEARLHEFIVFAEMMAGCLVKKVKTSEIKQLLKYIKVSRAGINYIDNKANDKKPPQYKAGGGKTGGNGIPKTTIEKALEAIAEKHQINNEDTIVIREICEEVSEIIEIKQKVTDNKENILFLQSYEPTVQSKVTNSYISRELWDQLDDPIYKDQGGIFSIMSKTVIDNITLGLRA